jgi:hypothetical protein
MADAAGSCQGSLRRDSPGQGLPEPLDTRLTAFRVGRGKADHTIVGDGEDSLRAGSLAARSSSSRPSREVERSIESQGNRLQVALVTGAEEQAVGGLGWA